MDALNPVIKELNDAQSRALLARKHVGRLAFVHDDGIDVEPISYSYDHDWIFGRTSIGTKLSSLVRRPTCAFEVDEISGQFQWVSVVARGTFYLLDPEAGSPELYRRALQSVRALVPDALGPGDPTPERSLLFGMFVSTMHGRASHAVAPHASAAAT